MNYTLNLHGDMRVRIPSGLPELLSDIAKEVLRQKPIHITLFIADYLDSRLISRQKAINATELIDNIFKDVKNQMILKYETYGITKEVAYEAASKIQALYKGYKVRRSLKDGLKIENEKRRPSLKDDLSETGSRMNSSVKYLKPESEEDSESVLYMPPSKLNLPNEGEITSHGTENFSLTSTVTPPMRVNVLLSLPTMFKKKEQHNT